MPPLAPHLEGGALLEETPVRNVFHCLDSSQVEVTAFIFLHIFFPQLLHP